MLKTVITRTPNERVRGIFKSNSYVEFHFFSYYEYESLPINKNFIKNISKGHFDWVIITSYKSWKLLRKQLDTNGMHISNQTKIAAFGPETAGRIIQSGGKVNFTKNVKNSSHFSLLLSKLLEDKTKIAYPASSAAGGQIEKIFSQANMQITRQNLYKPNSILDYNKIKEMIYSFNPNAIVFLSAASAKLFIKKCSKELLNKIKYVKLFAIGTETASVLEAYTCKNIGIPDYPSINILSKMIFDFAERDGTE